MFGKAGEGSLLCCPPLLSASLFSFSTTQPDSKDDRILNLIRQLDAQHDIPDTCHRKRYVLRKGRTICWSSSRHSGPHSSHIHQFHSSAYHDVRTCHKLTAVCICNPHCDRVSNIDFPRGNCQRY